MSEYIEFYAKAKENNTFICLGAYSRSSTMYRVFREYAPAYTNAKPMDKNVVDRVKLDVEEEIKRNKEYVKEAKRYIKLFAKNPNVNMDLIDNQESIKKECKEDIQTLKYILHFIEFLGDIEGEIWFGIECGMPVVEEQDLSDVCHVSSTDNIVDGVWTLAVDNSFLHSTVAVSQKENEMEMSNLFYRPYIPYDNDGLTPLTPV